MEQNKLDSSQIIGFLFLIGAFLWMFMFQPDFEEENKITNDVVQENIDNQNDYESTENFNSKLITVTEVRMTPDLKTARVYVIPLGGVDTKETVRILTEYSHLVRKALSKRLDIKFLPKLTFVEDNSFEYAEKIEKIIKRNKENDKEKKRYN